MRSGSILPVGTKPGVTEASVLRAFAKNIEHAALHCGAAGASCRPAYFDALRRAEIADLEDRLASLRGRA